MNNFKELELKPVYDSDDDIVEFYSKVLSRTKNYDRVSAYVETGFFKLISKGIFGLIKSGGQMNLIVSTEISDKALESLVDIRSGSLFENEINKILEELNEEDPRISDVNFLISIKKLNVKVAILNTKGFVHEKYGILEDFEGNQISMSGSNNDTVASIKSNFESFEITKTWNDSLFSLEKVNLRKSKFKVLWADKKENIIVIDIKNYIRRRNEKFKKDIPSNLEIDVAFIDIIDDKTYLKTNFNIDKVFESKLFADYLEFIVKKSDNYYTVELEDYDDLKSFVDLVSTYQESFNFKFFLSETLEDILNSMVLDLKKISNIGLNLKESANSSPDTIKRIDNLNSLLKRPLRTAQALASLHLVDTKRAMNFSVPGSGKTAMIIGSYAQLKLENKVDKIIVFGPKSIFKSWKDEYQVLLGDKGSNKVLSLVGENTRNSKKFILDIDYHKVDVIIVNYEAIESIATSLLNKINHRTLVVFDEIHRLKKFQGKRYSIASQISKKASYRVALTGTPLPNGYQDLHNMFEILFGKYSKSYFKFYKDNLAKENKNYKITKQENEELNELIFPFFVRITKKDLNIKPPNEDKIIRLNLTGEEKLKYDYLKNSNSNFLAKIAKLSNFNFDNKESETEDISSVINELIGEEEPTQSMLLNKSSKIKEGLLLVQELLNSNKKVLVWTVYLSTLSSFENLLKAKGIKVRSIYGSTSSDDRNQIIDEFNFGDLDVLITNPQTLSESVSLHHNCHDAIYLEQPLNLSQYLQSRDRIHRLGIVESQETNYYFLFNYSGNYSFDNRIYDLLKFKELQMYKAIQDSSLLIDESFDEKELKSLV